MKKNEKRITRKMYPSLTNTHYCRICLSKTVSKKLIASNMRSPECEQYLYFQCARCNSISISDVPDNLAIHYDGYLSFYPIESDSFFRKFLKRVLYQQIPLLSRFASRLLNRSSDLVHLSLAKMQISKRTAILDVGCGSGQLLSELSDLGFTNLTGIDPYLPDEHSQVTSYQLYKMDLQDLRGNWDLIMLNHVFEHIEDYEACLAKLKKLASPNGQLLIRIPNSSSYAAKKFKEKWFGIQPPIHIFLPSKEGMEAICKRNGLQIKKIFGENVLELWLHSVTYELSIWDGHPYSICKNMKNRKLNLPIPTFSKSDIKYWKQLNQHVKKHPILCDWVSYVLSV